MFENLLILSILYDGCRSIALLQPPEVVRMLEPSANELVGPYIKELLAPVDIANKGEYSGNLFFNHRMTSTCNNTEGESEHTVNRGPVQKAARRETVSI